jgi:hypothetical protein
MQLRRGAGSPSIPLTSCCLILTLTVQLSHQSIAGFPLFLHLRELFAKLLSVARRFLSSEEDARDAVQDAFAAAFESINRFNGEAALSTWLHRIPAHARIPRNDGPSFCD